MPEFRGCSSTLGNPLPFPDSTATRNRETGGMRRPSEGTSRGGAASLDEKVPLERENRVKKVFPGVSKGGDDEGFELMADMRWEPDAEACHGARIVLFHDLAERMESRDGFLLFERHR